MQTDAGRLTLPSQFSVDTVSATDLVSELHRLKRPVDDISFRDPSHTRSSITGIKIGQLVLHEARADAAVSKLTADPQPSLIIPFSSGGMIVENGRPIVLPALTHIAAVSLNQPAEFHFGPLHLLGIRPDVCQLNRALASILGDRNELAEIMFGNNPATVFPGRIGGTDYVEQILSLVSVVNSTGGDQALLNRIGMADVFTRLMAEFLVESVTGHPISIRRQRGTRSLAAVDIICSHIEANIGSPLTVVKMEELTGMTGRALNYAFHERFHCSPQQWQRRYLLDLARKRLTDREDTTSIKGLAYELGFTSSSSFTSHYSRRFGERPSETRSSSSTTAREMDVETGGVG